MAFGLPNGDWSDDFPCGIDDKPEHIVDPEALKRYIISQVIVASQSNMKGKLITMFMRPYDNKIWYVVEEHDSGYISPEYKTIQEAIVLYNEL